jgi:hypothetical protein
MTFIGIVVLSAAILYVRDAFCVEKLSDKRFLDGHF